MRNIELKSRYGNLARAAGLCARVGCKDEGSERQVDTYFSVPSGRLKLRQCTSSGDRLIHYQRGDESVPRPSDFLMFSVEGGVETLKEILANALGVRGVVAKSRHLYLLGNLRIHLDEVDGLGNFLEFEYVVENPSDEMDGEQEIARMTSELGIGPQDVIARSYADLIIGTNETPSA